MAPEDAIAQIKREIIETHNLIIKTDNLVKNLSADIRQIQKKQEQYERKYIFNSIAAYVIFVVVIFGGLYVAFDAKVGVVNKEKEHLEQQVKQLEQEAAALKKKIAQREQQDKITERFLLLKKEGKYYEALKTAESLDSSALSPAIARLVKKELNQLRAQMAEAAFTRGIDFYKKTQMKRALQQFDKALELSPPPKLLARIQHNRGMVFVKLKKNAAAARAFLQAAELDPESAAADNDLFMAAGSFEAAGDAPSAIDAYKKLLEQYPRSAYRQAALRRLQRLSHGKLPETVRQQAAAAQATRQPRQEQRPRRQTPAAPSSPQPEGSKPPGKPQTPDAGSTAGNENE